MPFSLSFGVSLTDVLFLPQSLESTSAPSSRSTQAQVRHTPPGASTSLIRLPAAHRVQTRRKGAHVQLRRVAQRRQGSLQLPLWRIEGRHLRVHPDRRCSVQRGTFSGVQSALHLLILTVLNI